MENQTVLCECMGTSCKLSISLPFEEAEEAKKYINTVVIIDGCSTGPEETDELINKKEGYSVYKDS